SECDFGTVCDTQQQLCIESDEPCSAGSPQGYCRNGLSCVCEGVCLTDASLCAGGGLCDCDPTQGCGGGVCVEVTVDTACAPERPAGACRGGETCVGGHCVPVLEENRCGAAHPEGWCLPGFSCAGGTCELTATMAC